MYVLVSELYENISYCNNDSSLKLKLKVNSLKKFMSIVNMLEWRFI
jgi:hypothetical protein